MGARETTLAQAGDSKSGRAIRIGARNLRIGCHPIIGIGWALFGGKQREQRREGVNRESLIRRQKQHFAVELEVVAQSRAAIYRLTRRTNHFDPQVVELELCAFLLVGVRRGQAVPSRCQSDSSLITRSNARPMSASSAARAATPSFLANASRIST